MTRKSAKQSERPELSAKLAEDEFRRWYWTLAELQVFARSIDISASGRKADLADRIAAALAGRRPPRTKRSVTADHLEGSLDRTTRIPANQRSTQELRRFFEDAIGPSFRFNGHMRSFLLAGNATLGDAVDHWYATSGTELPPQSTSLEFNRFTKAWHDTHPKGSPSEARSAWETYRALPVDQRPDVADL